MSSIGSPVEDAALVGVIVRTTARIDDALDRGDQETFHQLVQMRRRFREALAARRNT